MASEKQEKQYRVSLSFLETMHKRITEIGSDHSFFNTENDRDSTTKTIYAMIRFISNLDKMKGMAEYKERTGRTTMDIVRSLVYEHLNPEDDKKGHARPVLPRRGNK